MVRTGPPPPTHPPTPLPPLSVKRLVTALPSPTPDARLVHVETVDGGSLVSDPYSLTGSPMSAARVRVRPAH